MRLKPECARDGNGVDARFLPPDRFVATAMHLATMTAAERHRELIAHLAAKRWMVGKARVMRI
jgi:hypothetical protein